LQPVRGKVTLPGGKPVPGSLVIFEGEVGGKTISARGEVGEDGSFSMGTYTPGGGVPVGTYRVSVAPPPVANPDAPYVSPFNARFSRVDTSGLTFEVKPGTNEFPIEVQK
jgi:hypothetical protein